MITAACELDAQKVPADNNLHQDGATPMKIFLGVAHPAVPHASPEYEERGRTTTSFPALHFFQSNQRYQKVQSILRTWLVVQEKGEREKLEAD
jgi:hypothetical protein